MTGGNVYRRCDVNITRPIGRCFQRLVSSPAFFNPCYIVNSGLKMVTGPYQFMPLWYTVLLTTNSKPYRQAKHPKGMSKVQTLKDGLLPDDLETLRLFISS